jgi:hypothetical protein
MITQNNNTDNDEISLKEIILIIKGWFIYLKIKWKTIFLISFIGALVGLTIAYFDKPNYKAIITFAMEEDKGGGTTAGLGGALGLASSFGIDLGGGGGGAFAASNLTVLMKSRLLVEKALLNPIIINEKAMSLADYYIQFNNLRNKWNSNPKLKNISFPISAKRTEFSLQQDSILGVLYNKLISKENLLIQQKDKKVSILSIEVNSEDEFFSKSFCENLAIETSNFYIESKSKKAKLNVNVLQKQADSVKQELSGAISGVAQEADYVYNLNPAYNIKGAPSKKRQVDVQANTAVLTQIVIQLELAKINLRKETPLIQIIDKPILPLEKAKLGKLKSLIIGSLVAFFIVVLYYISYYYYIKNI